MRINDELPKKNHTSDNFQTKMNEIKTLFLEMANYE